MRIIPKNANPSGAYPPIQEGASRLPDGFAVWPDTLDTAVFYEYNGFVNLTIEQVDKVDTVTAVEPNTEAWEAWKASLPEETEQEAEPSAQDDTDSMLVDHEYRITLLELGITDETV